MVRGHFGSVPFALLVSVTSLVATVQPCSVSALATGKAYIHLFVTARHGRACGTKGVIGFCAVNQDSGTIRAIDSGFGDHGVRTSLHRARVAAGLVTSTVALTHRYLVLSRSG